MFAPQVRLASTDPWFPVSVEWFVEHSSLYFYKGRRTWIFSDRQVNDHLITGNPTPASLHQNLYEHENNEFTSHGNSCKDRSSRWYLKLKDKEHYKGMSVDELKQGEIPVYVHYMRKDDYIEIQYFYLYAFNGNIVDKVKVGGIHEGDWEHTSIRLSLDILEMIPTTYPENEWIKSHVNELKSCIICIYYGRHGKEGKWYFQEASGTPGKDDGFQLLDNTLHHIVYSAKGGHASYTTANPRNRRYVPFGFPLRFIDDYTDDIGEIWETWKNVYILDENLEEQAWLHFNGQWGGKPTNFLATVGPYGPLMKTYYFSGDPEPTETNSVYNDAIPHPCAPHLELWVNFALRAFLCFVIGLVVLAILYFLFF